MRFGHTRLVRTTPAVTAGAYSAGNVVGGIQTIGPLGSAFGRGIIKDIAVVDKANQKAAMTVLFFSDNPTASTFTDKAAPVIAAADEGKFLGKVEIATTDWTTIGAKAVATKECSTVIASLIAAALQTDGQRTIYSVVVTSGTPTYASTSDLTFIYGLLLD